MPAFINKNNYTILSIIKRFNYTENELKIWEFGKASAADLKQRSGTEATQLE